MANKEDTCIHGVSGFSLADCEWSPSHWCANPNIAPEQQINNHVSRGLTSLKTCMTSAECIAEMDMFYCEGTHTKVDIWRGNNKGRDKTPLFGYIHGGYWQEGSRKIYAYPVESLCARGGVVGLIGYDLAPAVTLSEMISQIRASITFLCNWAQNNGCLGGVYLCGHSSGAHLLSAALLMLADDQAMQLCQIKGLYFASGVYDLHPLVDTYIGRPMGLTMEIAKDISVMKKDHTKLMELLPNDVKITVVVGENESAKFKDESLKYHDVLQRSISSGRSIEVRMLEISGENHFSLIENLKLCSSTFTEQVAKDMQLTI